MPLTLSIVAIGVLAVLAGGGVLYIRRIGRDSGETRECTRSLVECAIIKKYINNFVMVPAFRANSKKEAIEKLVEIVGEELPEIVVNVEHAKQSVFDREESMPPALTTG